MKKGKEIKIYDKQDHRYKASVKNIKNFRTKLHYIEEKSNQPNIIKKKNTVHIPLTSNQSSLRRKDSAQTRKKSRTRSSQLQA